MKDMKLMIESATEKSREEIGKAIQTAKKEAIKDLQKEYDAILVDLSETDTTKEDLENETKEAIAKMKEATISCKEI